MASFGEKGVCDDSFSASFHWLGARISQLFDHGRNIAAALVFAVALTLFGMGAPPAVAAPTLDLSQSPGTLSLTPYLDVLEDSGRQFGQENVLDPAFQARFEPLNRGSANFGFSDSDWWIRVAIVNSGTERETATILLDYPLLDYVDVWALSDGQLLNSWHAGNKRPFSARPVGHRDFLFPISLESGEELSVYFRFRTEGPVNIGLKLFDERTLLPAVQTEYFVFGAYFGGFLLLALCVSLLYLVDRQPAFLYYLAYILSYGCYMLAFNGLATQYLWPESPMLGQLARPVSLVFAWVFLLQFSRSLLGIQRTAPRFYRGVTILQIALLSFLLIVPFTGYGMVVAPLAVLNLVALLTVIAMGVFAQIKGESAARYYLLAWSVFLIGVLAYLFKVFGWLPHNFVTHYGFQIGSIFEFIFLSIALGVRVKELRRLSRVDELTGLPNRRSFDIALAHELSFSIRPKAELSLLVVDVDHFKRYNDKHGHAAGDRVLKQLARLFEKEIRRPGSAYRYGGEEFVVLLPRTNADSAMKLAERLRARVEEVMKGVTISVGVASRKDGGFSGADEFFIAGDRALYQAKNTGRNRVVLSRAQNSDKSGETQAVHRPL